MSDTKHTPSLADQLREAEEELAFVRRMYTWYRIPERLVSASMRVDEIRAAIAAATAPEQAR